MMLAILLSFTLVLIKCSDLRNKIWNGLWKSESDFRNREIESRKEEIEAIKIGQSDFCYAIIMFLDDKSAKYVAELRTNVYKALARTHKEAVERLIRTHSERKER